MSCSISKLESTCNLKIDNEDGSSLSKSAQVRVLQVFRCFKHGFASNVYCKEVSGKFSFVLYLLVLSYSTDKGTNLPLGDTSEIHR